MKIKMCMSLALRLHSLRIMELTALGNYEKMIFWSLGRIKRRIVHGGHSQVCLQHIQTKMSFRLMQSLYVKYGYRSLV